MECRYVRDDPPYELLRVEDREPECGHDFCNLCGECLACFGDPPCYESDNQGPHVWVVYVEDDGH